MDGPDVIENTARAVDYCLRHPQWRLSLQTHKTSASDRSGLIKDVGIDEIVPVRGGACAAGTTLGAAARKSTVTRSAPSDRARHA